MKTQSTTTATANKARNLSRFLFNKVTSVCQHRIEEGEEDTKAWIKAIENEYNVIA